MRVLLPALASSAYPDGVSRHAANLALSLLLQSEVERIDLVIGTWQQRAFIALLEDTSNGKIDHRIRILTASSGPSSLSRNRWYWSRLPGLARTLSSDLVHLAYPAPVNGASLPCPAVVTLHDLYPYDIPENFGYPRVLINRLILRQCLNAVDRIACVSDSTAHRLQIHLPFASPKAVTIPNCLPPVTESTAITPIARWHGEPFLLCVAQHRRNKNIPVAIRTFQRLFQSGDVSVNTRLLIVGATGPETAAIKRLIHTSRLHDHIWLLNDLTDAELRWCYSHCELMLAPSTIEGFGLPVIEAMLHRSRILCSDIAAFREVGGSYCDYAELTPDPVASFVSGARNALVHRKFRAPQLERFSIAVVAEAYLRLYQALLKPIPSGRNLSAPGNGPVFKRGSA